MHQVKVLNRRGKVLSREVNFNIKVLCLDRRTSSHKLHHKVQHELNVFRDDVARTIFKSPILVVNRTISTISFEI